MNLNIEHLKKPGATSRVAKLSDLDLKQYASESKSMIELLQKCGYSAKKGCVNIKSRNHILSRLKALKIKPPDGQQSLDLKPYHSLKPKNRNGLVRRSAAVLRRKLIRNGVQDICNWCRCEHMIWENNTWKWYGKLIRMQVDHINGHSKPPCDEDDRLDNIRFLCYNCHTQTHNNNSRYIVNPSKKKRKRPNELLTDSAQEYTCQMCKCEHMQKGLDGAWMWNGLEIKLQCDHIDGDRSNNQISNLRWLCPLCHSTTDTYCGRNIKRKREQHEKKSD